MGSYPIPPILRPLHFSILVCLLACLFWQSPELSAQTIISTFEDGKKPHFRTGLSVRQISADFTVTSQTTLPFATMDNLGMGMGDVGFYTGTGNIVYEDGSVGPDTGQPGAASGTIDELGQISSTGRVWGGMGGIPVDQVTFSTMDMMSINDATTGIGTGLSISDSDTVVGPYIDLVFPIYESEEGFRNYVVGYRFYDADLGFGPQMVGRQRAGTFATTYTYTYDFIDNMIPTNPGDFPYDTGGDIIYHAMDYDDSIDDFDDFLEDPRKTVTTGDTTVDFLVISQTTLDVKLHEIPFGFECGRTFGRSTVAFTAGGTINIVDVGMTSRTDYYQYGGRNLIYSRVSRYSDTPVKLGAYAGFNITRPLNENGSVYLNIHGSYRWVDTITASTADISAVIDLSSWEGGVGIGIILD